MIDGLWWERSAKPRKPLDGLTRAIRAHQRLLCYPCVTQDRAAAALAFAFRERIAAMARFGAGETQRAGVDGLGDLDVHHLGDDEERPRARALDREVEAAEAKAPPAVHQRDQATGHFARGDCFAAIGFEPGDAR